ncbi:MAG: glycoside hydrolase family 31 protein [Ruminococcaceae bacterium]|nr:glycoside hydrolase family 31 protein [Oscillospiraceae bacterium]
MKIKLIATMLLLVTLFCTVGCVAVIPTVRESDTDKEEPNFIQRGQGALLNTKEFDTDQMINVAATDGEDKPLFQIVYDIGAGPRVKEQCMALAADIYDITGVEIPVVHSSEKQITYEITVGEVKRTETLDAIDSFEIEDADFAICAVDTRVVIYAETDQALCSGVIFFMEQAVSKSALEKAYGIRKDYNFTYHPYDVPNVELLESEDDRCIDFSLGNGPSLYTYVRLSYTGNSGWRIQTKYREGDSFRDDGAAQILAYSMGEYTLGTEDHRFYTEVITKKRIGDIYTATAPDGSIVRINLAAFRIDFYTPSGKLASSITNITHNAGAASITGVVEPNEAIFGTGERFNSVNQRGKKIDMFTKDFWSQANACYMVIPLLCFSRGSGVFINNYEHMVLDLDSKNAQNHSVEGKWTATVTGAPLDCYVYTTEQIADVIRNYSRLSGYADMPEEWTYGMLVCAYSPDLSEKWSADVKPAHSEVDGRGEGVYEMIANMEAHDLPWTGVIAEAWGPYIDYKHEDLKELCDYVHSLGKKFLVYMRVGNIEAYMKGFDSSYFLTQTIASGAKNYNLPDTTADTNNPDAGAPGQTHHYIDITNPEAMAWFFDEYWNYLAVDIGVDGCKIDFCETLPENYKLNYFDENVPTAGSHHWYPTAFCTMFYDMIASKPDGGMCYTRGGGIGAQRAPYMWTGDQHRFWDGIQYQLKGILSSGLSGVPYMSHDMAGYQYGDLLRRRIDYESSVFLRGTQYTAFTLCMQTHGTVRRSYQFAQEFPVLDAQGNEVKDADGDTLMKDYTYVTEIYRAYTKLHEHLTPYITELSREAGVTGMPVMRHLVLGWQDDANVYSIDSEYTFGDAFLIAPILEEGTSRSVYLPKGIWEDLNTGEIYTVGAEGKTVEVNASIAELPSFFNMETESETARDLVAGIKEIYDYARSVADET